MKTTEEKAMEYSQSSYPAQKDMQFQCEMHFEAGAEWMHEKLTRWNDIQADPKWGFATDDALDEIFRKLPRLVKEKRSGEIELIDYDNASEWRGDIERKPTHYCWREIHE